MYWMGSLVKEVVEEWKEGALKKWRVEGGSIEEGNIEDGIEILRWLSDEKCLNVGELKWRMEGGVIGLTMWREDAEGRRILKKMKLGTAIVARLGTRYAHLSFDVYTPSRFSLETR